MHLKNNKGGNNMKFKNIILISLILLSVLTLTTVSASENNATNEVIGLENTENIDNLSSESNENILEQSIASEDDGKLKASIINESSEATILSATNEPNILSVSTDPADNIVLKSAKKISATKVIAFKKSKHYPVKKILKTKDTLYSIYPANPYGQFGGGLTLQILNNGLSGYALHTKVKKVKFYYKNKKTGKYKIRTVTKIKNNKICIMIKSPFLKGYKPVKAKVWYTSR